MVGPGRILRDFTGWTSAHGLPHVGNARNIYLRLFWAIICLLSLGLLVFQIVVLVLNYLKYDVTVQTELKFEERDFPAVTLCNINPFKFSQLAVEPKFTDMLNNYSLAMDDRANETDPLWSFNNLENDTVAIQSMAKDHLVYISSELRETNLTLLERIIFHREDLILSCAYNTKPCDMINDFTESWNAIYGSCYTFNANSTYKSNRAGPLYGVRMLVKTNQSEYLRTTESVGMRVIVHAQDEQPFPDALGYNSAAGFTSSFGIKYIRTERMDYPYGNCTRGMKMSEYYYDGIYTTEGCFRSCLQRKIIEACGCADPRLGMPNGWKLCRSRNSKCVSTFTSLASLDEKVNEENSLSTCDCQQPCDESTHGVTVSTALWPSQSYTPAECVTESVSWKNEDECRVWYGENTLLIEVFYERMNYQLLLESEAYSLVQLISDIGGQLGLWMGISVITMVEVFSLLIALGLFYGLNMKTQHDDDASKPPVKRKNPLDDPANIHKSYPKVGTEVSMPIPKPK